MKSFSTALVVFAHPDDAEFLCGGTIAAWARAGTTVHYVCATEGSAGWNGGDLSREEIARIRAEELRASADVLGVTDIHYLGFTDGALMPDLDLRRAVTREVRRYRPDVILTFDPTQRWSRDRHYINHPDHRAIGSAVLDVVACDAPTRPQFPELLDEGFDPHSVAAVWLPLMQSEGDNYVDIGETIDLKLKALRCHASQLENMGGEDIDARIREFAEKVGKHGGFTYAEAFRTLDLGEG